MNSESQISPGARRFIILVDRMTVFFARHWIALTSVALFIFIGLPTLAPVLMHYGYFAPAELIYTVYRVTCHQLSFRSFFLFGGQSVYTVDQLQLALGVPGEDWLFWAGFRGSPAMGYKMAFCERDFAIYSSMLLAGLVFGMLRPRVRPLNWRIYILLLVPMAIDGLTQLFGLRESDYILRTITGILFGAGSVWLIYPYVQDAMNDIEKQARDQWERAKLREQAERASPTQRTLYD